MKYKTTRKAIKEGCINIRSTDYCALQNLLRFHNPIAYTCGMYGWNFDVYQVHGITITTGYRGMIGKDLIKVDDYESKARAICCDYDLTQDEQRERIETLLKEFCQLQL